MKKLAAYLNRRLTGAVYVSRRICEAYSTDQSGMKMLPQMVAVPTSTRDVQKLVVFAGSLAGKGIKLGITPRGSGTDKTGAAIGQGIVVSMREEMNKILEIDTRQKLVRVQAGVTIRELNNTLALHGMTLPIAADDQTVGGLLAKNFTGPMSAKYGGLGRYVTNVEVVLADGTVASTAPVSRRRAEKIASGSGLLAEIYKVLLNDCEPRTDDETTFGYQVPKREKTISILPMLLGSQGTLGVMTEVIFRTEYFEELPTMVAVSFETWAEALEWTEKIVPLQPSVGDVYDMKLLNLADGMGKALKFLELGGQGVLMVVGFDEEKRHKRMAKALKAAKLAPESVKKVVSDEQNYEDFLQLREVMGVFLNETGRHRVAICDDVVIPREQTERFMGALSRLGAQVGTEMPFFGSLLTRQWSVRPDMNERKRVVFLQHYARLVKMCGGAVCGAVPEGRTRAGIMNRLVDGAIVAQNKKIKQVFDPNDIMNPGVKDGFPPERIPHFETETAVRRVLP